MRGEVRHVLVAEEDAAAFGNVEAGDVAEQRCLAAAGGAEEEKISPGSMRNEMPLSAICSPNF